MKHFHSRRPAEIFKKWNLHLETLIPLTLVCLLVFCQVEVGHAGLACISNPCLYGICVDEVNGTFSCYCIDGYTGLLCQTNWDECWSNPCFNGGVCVDGIAQFNCSCPPGYQGDLCEQNINECDSNPCHNNGTCIDGPNGFSCVCPSGYVGNLCETDISVCNDTREARCLNGGLCLEGPGFKYNCACPLGWSGQFCEEDTDECASSPCCNGGVCLDLQANYTCACPFGFSGRNCEVELEMCGSLSPCQNGALCLVEDWLRVCYCVPDFHGDRCQFQYNECLLGPGSSVGETFFRCRNGGTCIDGIDGYDCSCPPGWSGSFCECQIVNENETNCGFLLPPPISAVTSPPVPTVPIWKKTEVPKTTPKPTTPKYFYSFLTECIPIWPQFTRSDSEITTQISILPGITPDKPTQSSEILTIPTIKSTTSTTTTTTTTTEKTFTFTTTTTETIPTTTTKTAQAVSTTGTTPIITMTPTVPTTEETITQPIPTTVTTSTEAITITTTTEPTTITTTTQTTPTTTTTQTTPTTTTTQTTPTTTTTQTTPTTTTTQTTPTTTTTETIQITTIAEETTETTPTTETTESTPSKTTQTTSTTTTTTTSTTEGTTTSSTTIQSTTISEKATTVSVATDKPTTILKNATQIPSTGISWNCRKIPCRNWGQCLNTTTGPRCACKLYWEGPFCDSKADIKVLGFSGKSYISHKLTNTHSIRVNLTARTISQEGIILFSYLGTNIFMTLYMEGGLLKFKFSCGVQTMLLSEEQFHINNGHDLVATVTLDFYPPTKNPIHCGATVRVNNTLAMSGEQLAKGPHADSESAWVYVGGIPTRYASKDEVPIEKGFTGCMQNLMINQVPRGIYKDSFDSDGVTECKSLACLSNPCRSGSTCTEHNNTWICHCQSGFLGRQCEKSVCNNNPCKFGGTCTPFPGSGFICLCPSGKRGLFCEDDAGTGYPLFASSIAGLSTFAAYKLPTEVYQDMLLTFKFLPSDMEQISLMIFIGQDGYHGVTSDHLAVSFIKGYVVLTWNLGSGPRRIFTKNPIVKTGTSFHTVQIGRSGQNAWLVVDKQQNVTGKSPGKLSQLNTRSMIYLGGHESRNFSLLPHDLPLHTGFSGCLFDVELRTGQMLIKVEKTTPAFSRGVGRCGRSLCNEHSCENGGGCIHHGATFTCLCSETWFGPTCSSKYNPCDSTRHNCSEGSTCVPLKKGFQCDCPVGRTGRFCEIKEELSDVKLKGERSYLAIVAQGLHSFQSCIDLEIRPLNQQGLILYSGRPESNSFWSLSLQDGILELRVSPGLQRRRENILTIKCRRLLTVGKWYRIRAGRYGRRLFLWVDGSVSTGVLLPGENLPLSGSLIFIGGVPDLSTLPVGVTGKILTPFQGCIRKFMSQWKRIPLNSYNILDGRNIEDCDGSVCGGDVCENGGTCLVNDKKEAYCTCLEQYIGKRCEYRLSCKEMNCQNGGRCAQEKSLTPQCYCPNGWGGPFCESGIAVKSPHFVGNSYLVIDHAGSGNAKRHAQTKVDVNFIHLNFTTAEPNGMLLWSSKENEYIGIGIENSKTKIVWAWKDCNVTVVTLKEEIADGAWHYLTVNFDSSNVTITIDGQAFNKFNISYPSYPIATDGRIFLGGFPESQKIVNRTLGHFFSGFEGCLQKISLGDESEIFNFSNFTGENIKSCDSFEI